MKLSKTQLYDSQPEDRISKSMYAKDYTKSKIVDYQVHLLTDSALIIPLINACNNGWDESYINQFKASQNIDYIQTFNIFKSVLKQQSLLIINQYNVALTILNFIDNKFQYKGKCAIFESQLIEVEKNKISNNNNNNFIQKLSTIRPEIYQYRKELKEIISICKEAETPLIPIDSGNLRQEFEERQFQLLNNVLPGLFFDDLSIEIVYQYLSYDKYSGSDEVNNFNQIKTYQLNPFIPRFKALIQILQEMLQQELNQTDSLLAKLIQFDITAQRHVSLDVTSVLFEIPQLIESFKINLNNQCKLLPQSITDDIEYLKFYEENIKLENKIQEQFNNDKSTIEKEILEKNALQMEFKDLKEQQIYFYKLYQFQKQIPLLIEKLRSYNQDRLTIWKSLPKTKSLNTIQIEEMKTFYNETKNQINSYFQNGKIPFKFLQVLLQCEYEEKQLQILQNSNIVITQNYNNNASLPERINELLKWEYLGEETVQGENGQINEYLKNIFLQDHTSSQYKCPIIEEEIEEQLIQINQDNYNQYLELNENYHIWKNMQAAGIFLNEDHLYIVFKDKSNLSAYTINLQKLLIFFCINEQKLYQDYIKDILQLIQYILENNITEAKQFIIKSKHIPKIYKQKLETAI